MYTRYNVLPNATGDRHSYINVSTFFLIFRTANKVAHFLVKIITYRQRHTQQSHKLFNVLCAAQIVHMYNFVAFVGLFIRMVVVL